MPKLWVLISLFILSPILLFSAFLQLPASASLAANANIAIFDNSAASILYNPAIFSESPGINISYHNLFSIPDLSYKNISASYEIHKFNTALGLQQFGNKIYKELTIILAGNYPINDKIILGLSYRFLQKKVDIYENQSAHQLDAGLKVSFSQLTFASSFSNITLTKLDDEVLPQECRSLVSYSVSDKLQIACSLVKELGYPFSFHFASSYKPIKLLKLSSGFQVEPSFFSAGFEINIFKATFAYAIRLNEILQETHYISLQYP